MSDIPKEHGKLLAHIMRQQHGTEMMPDEAREELISGLGRIRERMQELGHDVPESDVELATMAGVAITEQAEKQAMFDRVWTKTKALLDQHTQEAKPFAVTCKGHVIQRFAVETEAMESVLERNERAVQMGITARYSFSIPEQLTGE